MITQKTKLNAVIGFPLDHTLSPVLHNKIYQDNNIDAVMLAFANADVKALVKAIKTLNVQLAAVTMPHKEKIMDYLDVVDVMALKIGAVNAVINKGDKLYGYNTDIVGIERVLTGVEIKNKKVLIIGAGGVARPVAYYISQVGGLPLYHNRTKVKAEALAKEFGGQVVETDKLKSDEMDIIINTTPIGMYPKVDGMPVPEYLLTSSQIVMDIIYNPYQTNLLSVALVKGAKIISGLEMFIGQALEQVRLWQGKEIGDNNYINFLKNI